MSVAATEPKRERGRRAGGSASAGGDEEFLTPKQLATRLPVAVSTIWDWTRRRNRNPIPHYPISRKIVLFKWTEVVEWIEAHQAAR